MSPNSTRLPDVGSFCSVISRLMSLSVSAWLDTRSGPDGNVSLVTT
jgi:hypothetical protein